MIGEIIMMYMDPIVEYLCPACGNPYFGSEIASYSVFGAIRFSDGSFTDRYGFPSDLWLTRCPKCRQFFAKKHLFHFPIPPSVAKYIRYQLRRDCTTEEWIELRAEEKLYGRYDDSPFRLEKRIDFLEQSIEQGLYFPVNVNDGEKEELNILLHQDLWWAYNFDIDKVSNEKYDALCKKLIELLIGANVVIHEKELMLAELYRNIGDFEESRKHLDAVIVNQNTQDYVYCIKEQIEQKNTRTVQVDPQGQVPSDEEVKDISEYLMDTFAEYVPQFGHFDSWETVDEKTAIKTCDRSFYDFRYASVPYGVGWFFDAKSVPVGSNKPVKLIFNGVEYSAKLFNHTTNRIRFMLFWDRDLRKRFEAYKNAERKATFIKKENGVYEITLSGDEI